MSHIRIHSSSKQIMKTIYSDDTLNVIETQSIFLAGPTPRNSDVPSWRPEAIVILRNIGFSGTVFVPEHKDWEALKHYEDQVEWEYEALTRVSVIAFWIPREIARMPAFTTNVEFGYWMAKIDHSLSSHRHIAYGRPDGAPKTRYLDWLYTKETGKSPCVTLRNTSEQFVAPDNDRAIMDC